MHLFLKKCCCISSGYASFDYEHDGYEETSLTKLCISINNKAVDEFSQVLPNSMVKERAKFLVFRLKNVSVRFTFCLF